MTTEPDAKSQFKVVFKAIDRVPDAALGAIVARHEASMANIGFPYPSPRAEASTANAKF
jgi:hypothetical protein